jgi:uncharacterized protein YjeT (DUF2065 family)
LNATTLLTALGLMLVLEGILPFVAPAAWREGFRRLTELRDGQIRFFGLAAIALGVLVFVVIT